MEKFINFLKHPATISVIVLSVGILLIYGIVSAIPKTTVEKGEKIEKSWGKQDSTVTVEIWSDFQCPGCKYFWENVERPLNANYGDQVKFVYKHYPLSFHVKADDAAEASEAAREQGKFYEYADKLFTNQPDQSNLASWTDAKLIEYAEQIGLDKGKFETTFKSGKYRDVIKDYIKEGNDKGVDSTPTVFINGKEIVSRDASGNATVADYPTMEAEIQKLLGITPTPAGS